MLVSSHPTTPPPAIVLSSQPTHETSIPAQYATLPIHYQLFARLSADDSIEMNMSTFAAEMKEMAFILRGINRRSM